LEVIDFKQPASGKWSPKLASFVGCGAIGSAAAPFAGLRNSRTTDSLWSGGRGEFLARWCRACAACALGRRLPGRTMVAAGRGGRRGGGRYPVAMVRDIVSDGPGTTNVGGRARVWGSAME
jgi:hypothetical protein